MSKCLKNLKICKGACCRYFVFNLEMDDDLREYYNMHENTMAVGNQVFILNKCKHVTDEGKCAIYGKKRPKICSEGYTKQKKGVNYPEGCAYKCEL